MQSEQATCPSEEGEAAVVVLRKSGSSFPAQVTWVAEDGDAVFKQHYNENAGLCNKYFYFFFTAGKVKSASNR